MASLIGIAGGSLSQPEMTRFSEYVQRQVLDLMYQRLHSHIPYLELMISDEVELMFLASAEVRELMSGQIRYDLGLRSDEVESIIPKIANIIARDIRIAFEREPHNITFNISLLRESYAELLALPEASFIQEYSRRPGFRVEWLDWLLTWGDQPLVRDYRIKYKNADSSRSGGAIMIPKGTWRVPPHFSGNRTNNFITRSLRGIEKKLFREILYILK